MFMIKRSLQSVTIRQNFSQKITPIFLNYYSKEWFKYGVLESNLTNSKFLKVEYVLTGDTQSSNKLNDKLQILLSNVESIKILKNQSILELKKMEVKYIECYQEVIDSILDLLKEIQLHNYTYTGEEMEFLSKLMLNLNILNPALWAQFFQIFFNNIDQLVQDLLINNSRCLDSILQNVNKQFKTFRQENWGISYRQLIINEQEITSIVYAQVLKGYVMVMQNNLNNHQLLQYNQELLFRVLYEVFKMSEQYKRVGHLKITSLQQTLQKPLTQITQNCKNIDQKFLIQIYEILVELAIFDIPLFKILDDHLISYANVLFPHGAQQDLTEKQFKFIQQLLSCWKSHGQFNQTLFQVMKAPIMVYIKRLDMQTLISSGYYIITAQINDAQLIQLIINKVEKIRYQDLKGNERNLIHIFFRIVQLRNPDMDLCNCFDLIQHLNGYCQSHQQENQSRSRSIEKFSTCIRENENPKDNQIRSKSQNQKYKKADAEKIIVNQIIQYFTEIVSKDEELSFQIDYRHCLFEIDVALFIGPLRTEKIAIEVCGSFYGFNHGGLIGKKNNKFQLLQNDGWKLVVVKTQILQRVLSFQSGGKLLQLSENILNEVEQLIGRKLIRNSVQKSRNIFMTRRSL